MPDDPPWQPVLRKTYRKEDGTAITLADLEALLRTRAVRCIKTMQCLLDVCGNHEERRAQLAYIYEQLKRQVTRGEGLLTFQDIARATYEPEELL